MISWLEKHDKLSWSITGTIAVVIFYLSTLTFGYGGGGLGYKAIVYHIFAFFFLGLFLSISLVRGKWGNRVPLAIVLAILYGISDELHQFFVPGRSTSVFDVFLDSFGVLLSSVVYLASIDYRNR